MAGATLHRCDLFPVGTVVTAYSRRWTGTRQEGGPPINCSEGDWQRTATVAADGSLTFTGLEVPLITPVTRGTAAVPQYMPYAAYAEVNGQHRWLWFRAR